MQNVGNHHLYSKGCITWFALSLFTLSVSYRYFVNSQYSANTPACLHCCSVHSNKILISQTPLMSNTSINTSGGITNIIQPLLSKTALIVRVELLIS